MYITEAEMKMALGRLPAPSMITGNHFIIDLDPNLDGRHLLFTKRRRTTGPAFGGVILYEWVLDGTSCQIDSTAEDLRVCKDQLQDANLTLVESRVHEKATAFQRDKLFVEHSNLVVKVSELNDALKERDDLIADVTEALNESVERQESIHEVKRAAETYNTAVLDARAIWPVCIKTFGGNEGTITVEVTDE